MKTALKIGLVIADEMEFAPVRDLCDKHRGKTETLHGNRVCVFEVREEGRVADINAVLCGIGKVNAAAAAAFLISGGCDIIINSGLSGGISGVKRGDFTIGTDYVEHDFDLTPLGFKIAEKPGQAYIYKSDERLSSLYTRLPYIKPGVMACGDAFVASETGKDRLKKVFGAMSCDMESAAVASVCFKAGVPFIAVRRISDDADDAAVESYTDMNNLAESNLIDVVMEGVQKLVVSDIFFH